MSSCPNCSNPLPAEGADCPNCATQAFDAVRRPNTALEISGYEILRPLAEGGMGAIYLAEEKSLGRRVAIKVISGKLATEPQARARFMREARALATVEHANVVRVYSFGDVAGQPYLAMEYIDGETLAERIVREGRLSIDDAVRFMRQVLLALEAAWEKGIVHRDMKPSNVLIDRRGQVHVVDFGLAKPAQFTEDVALTQSGHVLGTPYYVSPEQAQGQPTDFRSDIYSCGIMLYEMLAGERPFEGTTPFAIVAKHLSEPLPSIRVRRPDVPSRVVSLIERMTEKRPERRPQSYEELIAIFDSLLGITPSKPIPATSSFSTIPISSLSHHRAGVLVAAVVFGALVGVVTYRVSARTQKQVKRAEKGLVIAVAPFYGPDSDSVKEGRVMAAMVERSITARLGSGVRVIGIDETKEPLRSHDAARALGERSGAAVVVWGEAFALKGETEIQPYFTLVRREESDSGAASATEKRDVDVKAADPVASLTESSSGIVRVEAEAPNQIELRKTSAEGVGEMVSFLAALHALYTDEEPRKALQFFERAPRTAEVLRHRAIAHIQIAEAPYGNKTEIQEQRAAAIAALEGALAIEPKDAQSRAHLGDLYSLSGRTADAATQYSLASAAGGPFNTSHGIVHDGLLWVREVFRSPESNSGEFVDTAYLLALDPAGGVVRRRIRLPGVLKSFRAEADGFTVTYAPDRGGEKRENLRFAGGRFDKPLPIGGNLQLRMRGVKSGWAISANFIDEFTGVMDNQSAHPRFRRQAQPDARFAQTLPDLESQLREAARRDPTQPWHLFFLGHALAEQGKRNEADAIWNQLAQRTDFGVLYIDYNWMAKFFERLGYRDRADQMYERAVRERRRIPQPIEITTLIERLVNLAFMRLHPEQLKDTERSYTWLLRARAMTGVTEADHYPAAAWASHFRRIGDEKRARIESLNARSFARHPFNFSATATRTDYAIAGVVAAWFGLIVTLVLLLSRGAGRARGEGTAIPWSALPRLLTFRATRRWLPFLIGLEVGVLFLVAAGVYAGTVWAMPTALALLAMVIALALPELRRFRPILQSLTWRDRAALIASFLAFIGAALVVVSITGRFERLAGLRVGMADSFGHPVIIEDLEDRLRVADTPLLRYVTAVANDLGGNVARAKELYGSLGGDERAARARRALDAGRSEIAFPTADEIYRAYTARPASYLVSRRLWKDLSGPANIARPIAITFVPVVAIILLILVVKPAPDVGQPRPPRTRRGRKAIRAAYLLFPGAYDLREGSPLRGTLMVTLFGFAVWVVPTVLRGFDILQSPGLLTAMALPNLVGSSPMPPDWKHGNFAFAPPYAEVFWMVVAIAFAALLVLHATRVRTILRLYSDSAPADADTLVTPSPVAQHAE